MNITWWSIFWGLLMGLSPLVIYTIIVACSGAWVKWVAPLIFILPLSFQMIGWGYYDIPTATFRSVTLGVMLYVFSAMVILFIGILRKPKKGRILKKRRIQPWWGLGLQHKM